MSTLTIKTSVSKEVEKKIILPSFWKEPGFNKYMAAIDEKTCISLFFSPSGDFITIAFGTCKTYNDEIIEADGHWLIIDESQFLMHYNDAHESIRMKPMMIDTGSDQAYTEFMKTQNF